MREIVAFGDEEDVRKADALLAAMREPGNLDATPDHEQYSQARTGRATAYDQEPETAIVRDAKAQLIEALRRVVDGNTEHATELHDYLVANPESPVGPPLWNFVSRWFPEHCWNAFCVNSFCPGVQHTDYTGYSWTQREGFVYNAANGKYNLPEGEHTGIVTTVYRRDAAAGNASSPE